MTELLRSPSLRSEWTKFRTVRGWVIGIVLAPVLTVLLGALTASGSQCGIGPGPGLQVELACTSPIGPGGQAVQDQFYFVHQSLTGNGSLTVRLTSLTGTGLQPCSKAGIMIKASVKPGSAYAAMLATAGLYIQDTAALRDLPLPPLTGLGVPTAWTATALLLAATVLRRRDA
jgi:hypothetical protein